MAQAESLSTENVVALTSVDQEVNLDALSDDLPQSSYDPTNFPGLVYRHGEPKAAVLMFRSGKVVCTGAKSIENVEVVVESLFDELRDLGVPITDPDLEVQNIVSSADIGRQLNLNAIAIGLGLESVEYEPEQFPGLVYHMEDPDLVTLLFASGKMVITGGSDPEQPPRAVEEVRSELDHRGLLD